MSVLPRGAFSTGIPFFSWAGSFPSLSSPSVSLNGETLSDIWSLDIPSQTWELLSPSSPRLNKMIATLGAAVFLYDEKLVYFGGSVFPPSLPSRLQSIFAVFSLQSREWQLVALAEQALLHHASFPLFFDQGTRLVSFGGIRFPVSLKYISRGYPLQTPSQRPKRPSARKRGFFRLGAIIGPSEETRGIGPPRGSEATSGGETPVPAVGAGGVGFPRGIGFGGDASVGGKSAVAGFFGANSARGPALFVFPRLSRHSHHPAEK